MPFCSSFRVWQSGKRCREKISPAKGVLFYSKLKQNFSQVIIYMVSYNNDKSIPKKKALLCEIYFAVLYN